jgi:hypothetical protein
MCHGKEVCMHCCPCCDKTYETYPQELWDAIPELQAALDKAKECDPASLKGRLAAYKAMKAMKDS